MILFLSTAGQIYVPKIIMMLEIQIFVNFDISQILPP